MILPGFKFKLRSFDWVLFGAVFLLVLIGLTAIYSVSLGYEPPDFENFRKQIISLIVGSGLGFVVASMNYSAFRLYSRYIYWGAVMLLVLVLLFGTTVRGTTGWFNFFGFSFQPVELAKVALLLFLAKFFANRFQQFHEIRHIVVSLVGMLILISLVLMQPDVGSSLVLVGLWGVLLFLSGVRWRYWLLLLLVFLFVVLILWFGVFEEFQKNRILTFINPELDPLGSGYNVTQAIIAIGSGGFLGQGLGFGSQSQLKFIPESQTDFIFAVVAEELGLVGVILVLVLYLVVFWRLLRAAKRAPDDFGMYFLLGIAVLFLIHLTVNVGMNLGLLPVTGISLPFLSYGGSFLIISLLLIGMAQSVISRSDKT